MNTTKTKLSLIIVGLGLAISGYSQSFLTNGLVAYYPFNGNANDASGNGRSLTNSGAVLIADRFNEPGSAFSFDGGSTILIETNSLDSLSLHDTFTLSCWVNIPSYSSTTHYSLVRKDGDVNMAIINVQSNSFYVEAFRNGTQYRGFSDTPPLGTWCMLTATWDGTNFRQFINGGQRVTVQDSLQRNVSNAQITLGGSTVYPSETLLGQLDDVRIYNRALSDSEVQALYVFESGPRVSLLKAVKPSFSNLSLGTNYQLQISGDLNNWTNQGSPFAATNINMNYPQYFDVGDWGQFFFRLHVAP